MKRSRSEGSTGKSRTRFASALLGLVVVLSSCAAPNHYQLYKSEHPTWQPRFPQESISIDELLAVVHAPATARNTIILVTHVRILGLGTDPWEVIEPSEVRSGAFRADSGRLYIVAARRECWWSSLHGSRSGYDRKGRQTFEWYVVRGGRLVAYDHVEFPEHCQLEYTSKGRVQAIPGFEDKVWELLVQQDPVDPPTR